jgi:antitoxin component of RelBE/YafQ-DinJ toxin-antitoxin module
LLSEFLIAEPKVDKLCRCTLQQIAANLHVDIFLRRNNVTAVQMPRKRITLNVDARIADALASIADRLGISVSRVGELELSRHLIELGELPKDYKPLGETRGGDTTMKKKDQGAEAELESLEALKDD